jgi:hypothetical protein
MKKGFVYGVLCALALAAPAAAEKFYLPVLGPAAANGGLATKVLADADGAERLAASASQRAGVIEIESEELYQAGIDVPLGDLPRPRALKSLLVGAANLSERIASCRATLSTPSGDRLAEVQFDVEPMSLVRQDGLAAAGSGRVAAVLITCDQSFYPFAVATEKSGKPPIVAKGIGPNGPCNQTLGLIKQSSNGHYITFTPPGTIFHEATKASPKGILCIRAPQELHIAKAVYEWDTTTGPWSSRDHSGLHNLGYFFLNRFRSGVVGNVNIAGPNKNFLKIAQNINMPAGANTNAKVNYAMQTGVTYHQIYTFDAANKLITLQVLVNGAQVAKFSKVAQPGNNQTLIVKPFQTAGLAMVAEFGNYLNQHHPEEASVGWKYSNFKLDMAPK